MERKYRLTVLPLFEEELKHIVDYITYVLHNRAAAHQLITDIETAIYSRLSCPESFAVYPSKKQRKYPYYKITVRHFYIFYVFFFLTRKYTYFANNVNTKFFKPKN